MKHQLVKKNKLPNSCPQCKNFGYPDSEDAEFDMGMMNLRYFCEKCEIKWTSYFEYNKDVIESLEYKIEL